MTLLPAALTTDELRAIALEVAKECGSGMIPTLKEDDDYYDFALRFLAAVAERQEPDGYIVQEETEDGFDYVYSASYPEAVHEHINETIGETK